MRVVITGMEIWCSIGRTMSEVEQALKSGCCGRRPVTRFDVSAPVYRTREAAVLVDEETLLPRVDETRIADLAITVGLGALRDAGFDVRSPHPPRFGVTLGTSHGGNIAFAKFVRGRLGLPLGRVDHELLLSTGATLAGQIARHVGARGPIATITTACASSTNSVGLAFEWIRHGRADVVLAGGADLFTELSFSGFNILGLVARETCRPLDRDRDGMMLGDGAAMLVLESEEHARRRGARAYAEIAGHATGNDAYHATGPEPDGTEASRVMTAALESGGISLDEVDYINLHGTGTLANDEAELRAVRRVFGERAKNILVSSTKSQVGHTLGAAGSVELVATTLGVAGEWAPPSIHLTTPMIEFADWSYVLDRARPVRIRAALSNSFGFAGNIASIVVRSLHQSETGP
jgi:3-oxoacyl-[acyl-carrier-protein] synthase II